jgi:predicted DCC family thiol-disulfide oxidoreductase YuxK
LDRTSGRIVLFDGVCNLCNGFVRFLIERDLRSKLRFGALQSRSARQLLEGTPVDADALETVVYLRDGRLLTRSTAAIAVVADLGGGWRTLRLLLIVPAVIRDVVYEAVSRRRYRWFGERDACMVPTPEVMSRFLPDDHERERMEAMSGGK